MSPGYDPKTITDVVVPSNTSDSSVYLDIRLVPNPDLPLYATEVFGTRYITPASNMTYPVWTLGPHDNQAYQLDASKWIVLRFFRPILDVQGNDLFVYRSSGSGTATVKASNDWRGPWQTLGTANVPVSAFDVGTAGFETVQYVRLEASGQFMLDALESPQSGTGAAENEYAQGTNRIAFTVTPTVLREDIRLSITNYSADVMEITFFNLLGQEVEKYSAQPGQSNVVLSHLPSGVYFLSASDSDDMRRIVLID
jgi:hypothetical protein